MRVNLQTALEALKKNETVTTLNLGGNNIGVNLQEIESFLERNLKMKQVYLKENTNIDDIKMTLSFSLNRQKQETSNDAIFYQHIIGGLRIQPFCSLPKDAINKVLTDLFSDCPEKIVPFQNIVKGEGGIFSLSGNEKIKNAEEAIEGLSSPPSTSPQTQPTKCTGCQIQ